MSDIGIFRPTMTWNATPVLRGRHGLPGESVRLSIAKNNRGCNFITWDFTCVQHSHTISLDVLFKEWKQHAKAVLMRLNTTDSFTGLST